MVTEYPMLTKEDTHWSSFRNAVVCLQQTLSKVAEADSPTSQEDLERSEDKNDMNECQRNNNAITQQVYSSREPLFTLDINDACNESAPHLHRPQDILSNNAAWDHANNIIEPSNSSHRQLELIGLEQVHHNNNNNGWNGNTINIVDTDHLVSHGVAPSYASQATNILSIAEQQLAETRLKLAMTESERDELEFQLIQGSC
jgi:hypothetical protein